MVSVANYYYGNHDILPPYSRRYYYLFVGLAGGATVFYYSHANTYFKFAIGCSDSLYYKALRATVKTKMAYFDTEN